MKLNNVALNHLGAKILAYSSYLAKSFQPVNILQSRQANFWSTTQGLPQFVIVSLAGLSVRFKSIKQIGFMLSHNYDSNPKQIELWVAQTTHQDFIFWDSFKLQQKKGVQIYQIYSLPAKFLYIKISITETYGNFETYLNQIFFMAENVTKKHQPELIKKISKKKRNQCNRSTQIEKSNCLNKSKSNNKNNKKSKNKIRNQEHNKLKKISHLPIFDSEKKNFFPKECENHKNFIESQLSTSPICCWENNKFENWSRSCDQNSQNLRSSQLKSKDQSLSKKLQKEFFQSEYSLASNSKILSLNRKDSKVKNSNNLMDTLYKQNQLAQAPLYKSFEQYLASKKNKKHEFLQGSSNRVSNESENLGDRQNSQSVNCYSDFERQKHSKNFGFKNKLNRQKSQAMSYSRIYNEAILDLGEHVNLLEDNMEEICRKVNVLDIKVGYFHSEIQKQLMREFGKKVDQIVDQKFKKFQVLKIFLQNIQNFHLAKETYKKFEEQFYKQKSPLFEKTAKKRGKTKIKIKQSLKKSQKNLKSQLFSNKDGHLQDEDQRKWQQNAKTSVTNRASRLMHHPTDVYEIFHKDTKDQRRIRKNENIAELLQILNSKLKKREAKLSQKPIKQKSKHSRPSESQTKRKFNYIKRNQRH